MFCNSFIHLNLPSSLYVCYDNSNYSFLLFLQDVILRQSPQNRFPAQIINKFRITAIAASTALLFACSSQETITLPTGVSLVETVTAQQDTINIPFKKYKLANGLTVILHQDNSDPLVHVDVTYHVGSAREQLGKSGFAHFFEHMMFKGSDKFPQDVYSDLFKNAGVDNGAYTTNDYTNYHLDFSKDHLDKVLEIQADHFKNLTYTDAQFKTEALTVKGEYLKNNASPTRKLLAAVRKEAFDTHTYKHTTMAVSYTHLTLPTNREV